MDKPEQEQLTPEQVEERMKEMEAHFTKQIPFLEKQKQYEILITEIEELRARRLRAQVIIAQTLADPPTPNTGNAESEPKVRTLKKES